MRVLDAALEVIAERGLAATRISDIAERAGMSAGHVLYYFRTKDLLLMEALRHVEDRMHTDVSHALALVPPGPQRLRRLLELNLPDGRADPGWTLWLEAWTLAPHDDTIRALVRELEERWTSLLTQVVRSGMEAGTFVCDSPADAVTQLYAAVNGLSVRVVAGVEDMTVAQALDTCMRLAAATLGFHVGRDR
jgi:AcrR family transcriptional regulator